MGLQDRTMGRHVLEKVQKKTKNKDKTKNLKIASLNIRHSFGSNRSQILLAAETEEIDILILTETDMEDIDEKNPPTLDGYTTLTPLKKTKNKTRILTFVKPELKMKKRTDLMNEEVSSIWLEIESDSERETTALIGGLYREFDDLSENANRKSIPSQTERFQVFLKQMEKAALEDRKMLITMGDWNLNRNKWNEENEKKQMMHDMQALVDLHHLHIQDYGNTLKQVFQDGRVRESALDYACISKKEKVVEHHKTSQGYTDHNMIVLEIDLGKKLREPVTTWKRSLKEIRNYPEKFVRELEKVQWGQIATYGNVDECVKFYTDATKRVLDKVAPMKQLKNRKRPRIRLSEETRKQMKIRDELQRRMKFNIKDVELGNQFRKQRRLCRKLIYKEQMEEVRRRVKEGGTKEGWKVANNLIKPPKEGLDLEVEVDGEVTKDKKKIGNAFGRFFVNKKTKLRQGIDESKAIDPTERLRQVKKGDKVEKLLELKPVTESHVLKVIMAMKTKTSAGKDEISSEILKLGAPVLHRPLCYIINRSMVEGKFPEYWKEAITVPIFKKKGTKENMKNYRPVALLCVSGMILEAIVNEKLTIHLETNNLMGEYQYGYRSHRGTATATATMISKAKNDSNKGRAVGMTAYDMSAAFDTVEKKTVCDKLSLMAVSKHTVKWVESYLENRTTRVKIGKEISDVIEENIGTPQGSRLSPLLFNVLMSDLDLYLTNGLICNFADDTSICVDGESLQEIQEKLQEDAKGMIEFTATNCVVLNTDKTAFICKGETGKAEITVGKDKVIAARNTELLGMQVAADLEWSDHVEGWPKDESIPDDKGGQGLLSKLRQRIGMLRILRHHLPNEVLKLVADAIFTSKVRYGIAIYCRPKLGDENEGNHVLNELKKLQNIMLRVIAGKKISDKVSSKKLREKFNVMSINHMCCYHILTETFGIIHFNSSNYLKKELMERNGRSTAETRSQKKYDVATPINHGRKNGFTYYAARLWNALPSDFKDMSVGQNHIIAVEAEKLRKHPNYADAIRSDVEAYRERIQEKSLNWSAKRFKASVKEWIKTNIPEE